MNAFLWSRPPEDFLLGGVINGIRTYDPWVRPTDLDMIKGKSVTPVAVADDDEEERDETGAWTIAAGMAVTATNSERDQMLEELDKARRKLEELSEIHKKELLQKERVLENEFISKVEMDRQLKEMNERHISESNKAREAYDAEIAKFVITNNGLVEKNSGLEADLLARNQRLDLMQTKLDEISTESDSNRALAEKLSATMSTLDAEKTKLIGQLLALREDVKKTGTLTSEMKEKEEQLKNQLLSASKELDIEKRNGEELRAKSEANREELQTLVDSVTHAYQQTVKALADAHKKHKSKMQGLKGAYDREMGQAKAKLSRLEREKLVADDTSKARFESLIAATKKEKEEIEKTHDLVVRRMESDQATTRAQMKRLGDKFVAKIQEVNAEIARERENAKMLKEQLDTAETEKAALEETVSSNKSTLSELRSAMEQSTREYEQSKNELRERVAELETTHKRFTEEVSRIEQERDRVTRELETANEQLSADKEGISAELNNEKARREGLEDQLKQLRIAHAAALEQYEQDRTSAIASLDEAEAQIKNVKEWAEENITDLFQKAKDGLDSKSLTNELENMKTISAKFIQKVLEGDREIADERKKVQSLTQQLEDANAQNAVLQQTVADMESSNQRRLSDMQTAIGKTMQSYEQSQEQTQARIVEYVSRIEDITIKLESQASAIEEKQAQIKGELDVANENLQNAYIKDKNLLTEELNAQLVAQTLRVEELASQLEQLTNAREDIIKQYEAEKKTIVANIEEAENDLKEWKTKVKDDIANAGNIFKDTEKHLLSAYDKLKEERQELSGQIRSLTAELKANREEVREKDIALVIAKEKIRESKNEEKNATEKNREQQEGHDLVVSSLLSQIEGLTNSNRAINAQIAEARQGKVYAEKKMEKTEEALRQARKNVEDVTKWYQNLSETTTAQLIDLLEANNIAMELFADKFDRTTLVKYLQVAREREAIEIELQTNTTKNKQQQLKTELKSTEKEMKELYEILDQSLLEEIDRRTQDKQVDSDEPLPKKILRIILLFGVLTHDAHNFLKRIQHGRPPTSTHDNSESFDGKPSGDNDAKRDIKRKKTDDAHSRSNKPPDDNDDKGPKPNGGGGAIKSDRGKAVMSFSNDDHSPWRSQIDQLEVEPFPAGPSTQVAVRGGTQIALYDPSQNNVRHQDIFTFGTDVTPEPYPDGTGTQVAIRDPLQNVLSHKGTFRARRPQTENTQTENRNDNIQAAGTGDDFFDGFPQNIVTALPNREQRVAQREARRSGNLPDWAGAGPDAVANQGGGEGVLRGNAAALIATGTTAINNANLGRRGGATWMTPEEQARRDVRGEERLVQARRFFEIMRTAPAEVVMRLYPYALNWTPQIASALTFATGIASARNLNSGK